MKKILISLSIVGAVAAIAIGATTAFFSDTETSTGNTFTAGAIDLKVDNKSYVTGLTGALVASPNTSWTLSDLTGQLFFNFSDIKPGDIGEDTISLHVDNNDAWLCAAAKVTANDDVTCTEPELTDDPSCTVPGLNTGELANAINFAFWADDGDNVYEVEEKIFLQGPIDNVNGKITLADSEHNVWGQTGALPGGSDRYIGKAWCFGTLTQAPVAQGLNTGPLDRGTGFTCSGAAVNNAAQTDRVMGDMQFYAEQARNNSTFTCATNYIPTFPISRTLILENKDADWDVINDNMQGKLTYNISGSTFSGTFQATGLPSDQEYSLIYYADKGDRFGNWGGDNPGALIGKFTPAGGIITLANIDKELNMDLPHPNDWNANASPNYCDNLNGYDDYNTCVGAKIWLVPSAEYDADLKKLTAWNPANYLFETDLINYNDIDN